MNKKGYFFFFQWGTSTKQETLSIQTKFKCNCKSNQFYLIYNLSCPHIFFFIPVGSWKIQEIFMQCAKCGIIYKLEGKEENNAIKVYEEAKSKKLDEDEEEEIEKKVEGLKPTKKKQKKPKKKETWLNNFKDDLKSLGKKK